MEMKIKKKTFASELRKSRGSHSLNGDPSLPHILSFFALRFNNFFITIDNMNGFSRVDHAGYVNHLMTDVPII